MTILLNCGNLAWKVKRKTEEEDLDVELIDFFICFLLSQVAGKTSGTVMHSLCNISNTVAQTSAPTAEGRAGPGWWHCPSTRPLPWSTTQKGCNNINRFISELQMQAGYLH